MFRALKLKVDLVSDIAISVLKGDVKLQLTNLKVDHVT